MSMVDEQWEFLQDVAKLVQHAASLGIVLTAGEMWRPPEMQEIYFKTGRSQVRVGGTHTQRLAVDFNFFIDGELVYDIPRLQPLGDYWVSLNPKNRWGGNWKSFKDVPHFERYLG